MPPSLVREDMGSVRLKVRSCQMYQILGPCGAFAAILQIARTPEFGFGSLKWEKRDPLAPRLEFRYPFTLGLSQRALPCALRDLCGENYFVNTEEPMLKAAVIGTGLIATKKHLPAWNKVGAAAGAECVAICDINEEQARLVASQYGIAKAYTDIGEMLDRERPDIVDICTPPKTHAPIAIQCLEGGANALIEKPMATSLEECDQIIAAAEKNNRKICMAHSDLFYPSILKARKLIAEGAIGEFRGMHIFLSTPTDYITSKEDHWANKLAGGVIGETGPHIVYLTLAWINPIAKVLVHGKKLMDHYPWSPFEDYRVILAGEKAVSSTTLTYATNHWMAEVQLWGTEGILRADMESQSLIFHRRQALTSANVASSAFKHAWQTMEGVCRTGAQMATRQYMSTHARLIREFAHSLARGEEPPVTAAEGRESIRVMDIIAEQLGA